MHITILTIFPEIFPGPLAHSIAGKALKKKLFIIEPIDIRDFAYDKRKSVDDKVFGGGAGMLIKPDVLSEAIDSVLAKRKFSRMIYFSPRGKKFEQKIAAELATEKSILILCGRYEGVDQRVFEEYQFEEYSIGDYILSGGEVAALTAIDACVRMIPGVIENDKVHDLESFSSNGEKKFLEYDQYTRPSEWRGRKVPEVLVSGNHKEIERWKIENSLKKTKLIRPDLL